MAITGAKKCVLHIAPVLLRELEEQKVYNKSERLRERANAVVKWFAELADRPDPIELRPRVELVFIEHEPLVDFAGNRLSERTADDLLIASATYVAANPQKGQKSGLGVGASAKATNVRRMDSP